MKPLKYIQLYQLHGDSHLDQWYYTLGLTVPFNIWFIDYRANLQSDIYEIKVR